MADLCPRGPTGVASTCIGSHIGAVDKVQNILLSNISKAYSEESGSKEESLDSPSAFGGFLGLTFFCLFDGATR
jgi:hypothetical protein